MQSGLVLNLWGKVAVDDCMEKQKMCWKSNELFVKYLPVFLGFSDALLVLVEVSGFQSAVEIGF